MLIICWSEWWISYRSTMKRKDLGLAVLEGSWRGNNIPAERPPGERIKSDRAMLIERTSSHVGMHSAYTKEIKLKNSQLLEFVHICFYCISTYWILPQTLQEWRVKVHLWYENDDYFLTVFRVWAVFQDSYHTRIPRKQHLFWPRKSPCLKCLHSLHFDPLRGLWWKTGPKGRIHWVCVSENWWCIYKMQMYYITDCKQSSWWLNQPISKICSSKWIISPNRDENKKYLKIPSYY